MLSNPRFERKHNESGNYRTNGKSRLFGWLKNLIIFLRTGSHIMHLTKLKRSLFFRKVNYIHTYTDIHIYA